MAKNSAAFSVGPDTLRVPMSLHADNRARLVQRLRARGVSEGAVVLLQGGAQQNEYDTDRELLFMQESFFQWLFGVKEPGCYGALEVGSGKATLFVPRLPQEWAVWMGRIHPPSHFQEMYAVDDVRYADEIASVLGGLKPESLLLLQGKNGDSGSMAVPASFPGLEGFRTDLAVLYPEMVEARVRKSDAELDVLRWVNGVSSAAHVAVMRACKPGVAEYQLEALFLHETYAKGGCRFSAYTCICGCGPNSAVLHYGHQGAPNDQVLRDGQMFLNDSGAEYHGYSSDITCSYPVNGRFTPEQKGVYETVLRANRAVLDAMRPGVSWFDMHRLTQRVIAEGLRDLGLLRGSVDELVAHHVPALFMPHGLGHLMGLDVHDCGGYPDGVARVDEPGIRSLRCGRALEAGMVITVEPGVYFIDALLEPALADPRYTPYLVPEVVARFRTFGGVRIEDDVIVTPTGAENMTTVPRDVRDVESVMAGGAWQPQEALATR